MKPKKNTDDETTVAMTNSDKEKTATVASPGGKKSKAPEGGPDELKLIHSYWQSGSAALKRQAVSRYARLMIMSPERAEAALEEWASVQSRSK
jgi:hypothetical protein